MVLRPSLGILEVGIKLNLVSAVLGRFFIWVWVSIILIFTSGYFMIFNEFGGMKMVRSHVHIMQGIAFIMLFIFLFIYFALYPKFKKSLQYESVEESAKLFKTIRILITANLHMGLLNVVIGSAGRYY